MSFAATKVMSLSSTSGAPTPPYASPCTDVSGTARIDEALDPEAVRRVLQPIEEELNYRADVAMLPSPPSNTPAFSPTPSVYRARGRGFSLLNDRLSQLKVKPRRDSDFLSNCSDGRSTKGSDAESVDGDTSSVGDRSTGNFSLPKEPPTKAATPLITTLPDSIPVALGSANMSPRIEEYIQFMSGDLPIAGSAEASPKDVPANDASHTRGASLDTIKTGVTEKSTWAEDAEDVIEHALLRLEQLAHDNHIVDPTCSMEQYYLQVLQQALASKNRKFKTNAFLAAKDSAVSLTLPVSADACDKGVSAQGSD